MSDGDDLVPFDDSDFDERAGYIRTYEHRH